MSFVCSSCGGVFKKWVGKCPNCGEWNTVNKEEFKVNSVNFSYFSSTSTDIGKMSLQDFEIIDLENIEVNQEERILTTNKELDNVLGGGFVKSAAVLIAGEPGIGKSTLLLQISNHMAKEDFDVLYISGEESINQISMRASRMNVNNSNIKLASITSVLSLINKIKTNPPKMLIVDSIQTMYVDSIESTPGSVAQIKATALELVGFCKANSIILVLVGHITKEGYISGPKLLEHIVDVVLYFEGDNQHQFRLLRCVKNRFGTVNEIGLFTMSSTGIVEVSNPSAFFLSNSEGRKHAISTTIMEGTRPMILEIESLVSHSYLPSPRRNVVGLDSARLSMIVAVLQNYCKISLHDKDIHIGVVGGFKSIEPSNDIAIAISLMQSVSNKKTLSGCVAIGEIGLSGQIRSSSWMESRIKECIKVGYTNFIVAKDKKIEQLGIEYKDVNFTFVSSVSDLLKII